MLTMGIAMSVSNILITVCAFVLRAFISNNGGTEIVGYYTAGFTIVTTYFSMIFNALATDYYPRLAAVNSDNVKCRNLSNEQGEIASLIMLPYY
ncbi:oligosaccharide flippase family protein [Bacteroides thetaiotaomicron]|nr:oligosaccharide flippase family protein [Bacteroides thetaiotaomicron]